MAEEHLKVELCPHYCLHLFWTVSYQSLDDCDFIYIYADDIFLLSNSFEHLQDLATRITLKLKEFGFLPNVDKYQYITNSTEESIQIEDTLVEKVEYIKYLGMYIDTTGICYEQDMINKLHKAKHAISTIKWTRYNQVFQDSYKFFFQFLHHANYWIWS